MATVGEITEPYDLELEPWAAGLTPYQAEWVREFLVDMNAYRACIRTGMKATTAHGEASRRIRRPVYAKAIAAAMHDRAVALNITQRTVLSEAFACYIQAAGDRNWTAAAKFLEMVGKHVDVQAFRDRAGDSGVIDDDQAMPGADDMTLEELETLARLHRKAMGNPDQPAPAASIRH